jgi:hypothetical protein
MSSKRSILRPYQPVEIAFEVPYRGLDSAFDGSHKNVIVLLLAYYSDL